MSKQPEQRTDLAGEHRFTDIGQIIGLIIFLIVWIPDSFIFHFSTFLSDMLPGYILMPAAVLLMAFAAVMAVVSHKIIFMERRDPPVVITKAFFRLVRHPLYLSEIMLYLGLFLLTCSLFSITAIAGIVIFLNYVAGIEERKLEMIFGAQYLAYKRRVGKWFPKLAGRKR